MMLSRASLSRLTWKKDVTSQTCCGTSFFTSLSSQHSIVQREWSINIQPTLMEAPGSVDAIVGRVLDRLLSLSSVGCLALVQLSLVMYRTKGGALSSEHTSILDLSDVGKGKDDRALILFRVSLTLANACPTSGGIKE